MPELLDHRVAERNTVVCAEHHLAVLAHADHIIDLGPGAGSAGGAVVAACSPREFIAQKVRDQTVLGRMRGLGSDSDVRLASAQRDNALRLAHAAPHAIRLSGTKGVLAAQLENWARVADGFRPVFTLGASPSALAVRVIKHV